MPFLYKHPLTFSALIYIVTGLCAMPITTCVASLMTVTFMGLHGLVDDPHVAKLLMGLCGLVVDDCQTVTSSPRRSMSFANAQQQTK